MTYELTLTIAESSPLGQNIEAVTEAEHVTREEAAVRVLAASGLAPTIKANPRARRIVGLFSSPEDAALMDEVMELVMSERQRRNAEPPRDF